MTIVDDEFAVVGSMNYNRRSWTHDSEVVAAIHDTLEGDGKAYHFAHRLRIASWATA
jgi:phosphatidylserine/phosphatidylglycerophosphate/cardiolipin synthase-like enzyme